MDPSIRRAALRAAAKTAIVLSLNGCAMSHGVPPSAAPSDAAPVSPDAVVAMSDGCEPHLRSLEITGDENPWSARFASEAARMDPHTGECCLELDRWAVATHWNAQDAGPAPWEYSEAQGMACCFVLLEQSLVHTSALGCTPWGPPVPPEMPMALA